MYQNNINDVIYDYLIIGSGISGLYTGYLLKKYFRKNVIVIEKEHRIGGRIYTYHYEDDKTLEFGAGVISASHNNLLNLIKHLKLDNKLIYGKKYDKKYYDDATKKTTSLIDTNFYKILDEIYNNEKCKYDGEYFSLFHLTEKYYNNQTAEQIVNQFGYSDDILHRNAINALAMFTDGGEFSPDNKHIFLAGGLTQIIDSLGKNLDILTNTECVDIVKENDFYICKTNKNNGDIKAKNIICAIPVRNILHIPFFKSCYDIYNSALSNKPLMRVYLQFPISTTGKVWFNDLQGVLVTNTIIRQIIPVNRETGLIMIYADGIDADGLYLLERKNMLKQEILLRLRIIFPDKTIPDPINIYNKYWNVATHVWKVNPNDDLINKLMKPLNEKVYIVGEGVSPKHSWIEGAIISVHNLIRLLFS